MKVCLFAYDLLGGYDNNGKLPWCLPDETLFFKETLASFVNNGFKIYITNPTYLDLPKSLKAKYNYNILTRYSKFSDDNVILCGGRALYNLMNNKVIDILFLSVIKNKCKSTKFVDLNNVLRENYQMCKIIKNNDNYKTTIYKLIS